MRPGFTRDRRSSYAVAVASIEAVNAAPVPAHIIEAARIDRGRGDRTLDRALRAYFDAHPAVIAASRSEVTYGKEASSCPGGHVGDLPCWVWHHNRPLYPDRYLIEYLARCIASGETEATARARVAAVPPQHRLGFTMSARPGHKFAPSAPLEDDTPTDAPPPF